MHYARHSIVVLSLMSVVLSGCDWNGEGLVGIRFRNGVECLGEDARPVAGDVVYVSPDGDDGNAGSRPDAPQGTSKNENGFIFEVVVMSPGSPPGTKMAWHPS